MNNKIFLLSLLMLFVLSTAVCVRTTKSLAATTDGLTRTERQALTGVLKKLQTCQNAELSGANFAFKVVRKGSMCEYYERNKDGAMTCNFPMDVAKKYGTNGVTLNNAILTGEINDTNPFVDSPINKAFYENINLAVKYCKQ